MIEKKESVVGGMKFTWQRKKYQNAEMLYTEAVLSDTDNIYWVECQINVFPDAGNPPMWVWSIDINSKRGVEISNDYDNLQQAAQSAEKRAVCLMKEALKSKQDEVKTQNELSIQLDNAWDIIGEEPNDDA